MWVLSAVESSDCKKCKEGEEETPVHLLCNCTGLASKRWMNLRLFFLKLDDIIEFLIKAQVAFINFF